MTWPWWVVRVKSPPGTWRLREKASTWLPDSRWMPGSKAAPELRSSMGMGTPTTRPPSSSTMASRPVKVVTATSRMGTPTRFDTVRAASLAPPWSNASLIRRRPTPGMGTHVSRGMFKTVAEPSAALRPMTWMASDRAPSRPGRSSLPSTSTKLRGVGRRGERRPCVDALEGDSRGPAVEAQARGHEGQQQADQGQAPSTPGGPCGHEPTSAVAAGEAGAASADAPSTSPPCWRVTDRA